MPEKKTAISSSGQIFHRAANLMKRLRLHWLWC